MVKNVSQFRPQVSEVIYVTAEEPAAPVSGKLVAGPEVSLAFRVPVRVPVGERQLFSSVGAKLRMDKVKEEIFAVSSVTRLGDLLHFGQLIKACGTIILSKSPTFLGNFCKGVKIFHFSGEIIFGQLLWTIGNFYWSHWL